MKQGTLCSEVIEKTEKMTQKTFADPTMTNALIKPSLRHMKRLKVNG